MFFKAMMHIGRLPGQQYGENARSLLSGKGGLAERSNLSYEVINQTFSAAVGW
jgi:hypothetical protein